MKIEAPYADLGTPLYWGNEHSGQLRAAILPFLGHRATEEQLEVVRAYIEYYLAAPCWERAAADQETLKTLATLREQSRQQPATKETLHALILDCLDSGIDPL
jgi:hypothetical protein